MNSPSQETLPPKAPFKIDFANFLESTGPSQEVVVFGVWRIFADKFAPTQISRVVAPDLKLYCVSTKCQGERIFASNDFRNLEGSDWNNLFLIYYCKNCNQSRKFYCLAIKKYSSETAIETKLGLAHCYKFGEMPQFGPHTPSRLISLIGPDKDEFLKGRKSETHGLGIGAFTYYRRVIENQKNRIIEEIIKVAKKTGADLNVINKLETALNETQFSKAISNVKDAIPPVLLIDGRNPLSLLHSALSVGVHEMTDEHCLQSAHDIRVVLIELAKRISQVLKDHTELADAVKRLSKPAG